MDPNFDVQKHIVNISDKKIEALIKPIFIIFEKSKTYSLVKIPRFNGAGVYGLFLANTKQTCYDNYLPEMHPIYIGKAVPSGSRQGKNIKEGSPLKDRLQKHLRSIEQVENLDQNNFLCKFLIFEGISSSMISTVESYLIKKYSPLWNSYIDGFGINAPGKGRYHQSPSEWDTIHPGRYYAKQLTGPKRDKNLILNKIKNYNP